MKTDITIQLKWLMLFMFMLFASITQASADSISSISGPKTIQKGQLITVTIDCESADKDLIVTLQKTTSPWTGFYVKRMHCNNNGKTTVTFTVPNKIPDGTALMYQAYLTKKGKNWADRVAVKWQTGVSLGTVNADKVISIHGPNPIQKGQSITVNVDCRTTGDNELNFTLQQSISPWTGYYVKRTQCNNNGKTPITFTVPNTIPDGTALMYQAYIAPRGKGWADRVDVKWQSGITLKTQTDFILGVNIGSTSDVTIDGHAWLSENDAKKKAMQIDSTHTLFSTNTDVTPTPAVDADMDTMLNSVRWASKDWNIKQPIGNGTYSVSVWIMENYRSHSKKIDLSVEGQTKFAIGDLEKGQWKKYTYSNVKVTDDMLDIVLSGNSDVHMMGFEVLGQTTGPDPIPPVLTLKGQNLLNLNVGDTYTELGATAIDNVDGDISAKIVIGGDTVDTSKAGTYTITYTVSDVAGNEATTTRTVIVNPASGDHWKLVVDGRMLKHADGLGFFWMGDTAWMLARNYILPISDIPAPLSRADVDKYLKDRAEKGFSVIQMSAVQDGDWLTNSTVHYAPFVEGKFKKLKSEYWEKVDYIIKKAETLGLYVALLPAWDMKVSSNGLVSTEKAISYGTAIANRYKNSPNIIWVIGGDSPQKPFSDAWQKKRKIWHTLGQTIQSIVGQNQLITYHPGTGIDWLLETTTPIMVNGRNEGNFGDSWLDFYMIQSGHGGTMQDANKKLSDLYASNLGKPIFDGEPRYEEIHRGFDDNNPPYGAKDVREIAYRQLFSGAFGHTYGNNAIWQFWKKGNSSCCSTPKNSWDVALNDDGAKQMKFVAKLMKSRPILNREAKQSLISNSSNNDAIATKGDGYAMVYLPTGGSVTVQHLDDIASSVNAWWYNPRNGNATRITGSFSGTQPFNANTSNDMVLVLDDASRGFAAPGQ